MLESNKIQFFDLILIYRNVVVTEAARPDATPAYLAFSFTETWSDIS